VDSPAYEAPRMRMVFAGGRVGCAMLIVSVITTGTKPILAVYKGRTAFLCHVVVVVAFSDMVVSHR
jgi:hypothetical protein